MLFHHATFYAQPVGFYNKIYRLKPTNEAAYILLFSLHQKELFCPYSYW